MSLYTVLLLDEQAMELFLWLANHCLQKLAIYPKMCMLYCTCITRLLVESKEVVMFFFWL